MSGFRKHGCGWGVCLPLHGRCSKDGGLHFKTGPVMVIMGIKWEFPAVKSSVGYIWSHDEQNVNVTNVAQHRGVCWIKDSVLIIISLHS